jgi:hypothetical protein
MNGTTEDRPDHINHIYFDLIGIFGFELNDSGAA